MRFSITSFRFKITISLIIAIATISFLSFYIFNHSIRKIIHEDNETHIISLLDILRDQYYNNLETGNKGLLIMLLNRTQNNDKVINTYFFDSTGIQTYPTDSEKITIDELCDGDTSILDKQIKLISFESGERHFTRAFVQMVNNAKCYECHSPNTKSLGYLVIDFSTQETEKSLVFVRKFSLFFTIILILIIIGLVIILHYRIVKTSLSSFEETINEINKGNLDKRIGIGKSKELGKLAKSFNNMVETFQRTQNELNTCHIREMEIKNKMASIGMMASRLAHEIRNPLTGIANATEIIVKEMPDDENKPILEEMRRQATRVNNAILNMLRFSHSHDIELSNKDLHKIIKALIFFIQNQVNKKTIEFKQELDPKVPLFLFDHEQIENVLLNLGLNAVQSINETGSITFATKFDEKNQQVLIMVRDTGSGMSEKVRKNVFIPFFTTRTEGTGLGLAISKEVVEKHKGKIWVESIEAIGSTFFISLPVKNEA